MNNALGVLGIAKKAGLLEIGAEAVEAASRRKKTALIMSASDASEPSKRRAREYAQNSGCTYAELPFSKSGLAEVIGRGAPGMIAVTDAGIAHSFINKLAEHDAGFGDTAEKLREAAERQATRRREAAAHKRNIRTGKGRTEK